MRGRLHRLAVCALLLLAFAACRKPAPTGAAYESPAAKPSESPATVNGEEPAAEVVAEVESEGPEPAGAASPAAGTVHEYVIRPPAPAVALELPQFPWPPPQASSRRDVPIDWLVTDRATATLGDLDRRLRAALSVAGYSGPSYFGVPGGYAVVTLLEQIEADGRPKTDPPRWSTASPRGASFSLGDYLRALLTAQPGYFRVVVFVVTPAAFATTGEAIDSATALAWMQIGLNRLPDSIAALPVAGAAYACTALVYEFERASASDEPKFQAPGRLGIDAHLAGSGLLEELTP